LFYDFVDLCCNTLDLCDINWFLNRYSLYNWILDIIYIHLKKRQKKRERDLDFKNVLKLSAKSRKSLIFKLYVEKLCQSWDVGNGRFRDVEFDAIRQSTVSGGQAVTRLFFPRGILANCFVRDNCAEYESDTGDATNWIRLWSLAALGRELRVWLNRLNAAPIRRISVSEQGKVISPINFQFCQ